MKDASRRPIGSPSHLCGRLVEPRADAAVTREQLGGPGDVLALPRRPPLELVWCTYKHRSPRAKLALDSMKATALTS